MSGATEPWWLEPQGDAHGALVSMVGVLEGYDRARRAETLLHLAMYGDSAAKAAQLGTYRARVQRRKDAVRFNAVKGVCDASQASIGGQRARPKVQTNRGDYSAQRAAQDMELCVHAEYEANNVYEEAQTGYLDAAKTGTTGFKISRCDGRPTIELVRPGQLLVDPVEGVYRKPRAIYEIAYVDRGVALAMYGSSKAIRAAIESAPRASAKRTLPWLPSDTELDQIRIYEAWRLPDPESWHEPAAGRHVIAVDGATILDEEWDRKQLPFVLWRYDTESTGMWGKGAIANCYEIQVELNSVLDKISACFERSAGYRIVISRTARISVKKITNEPGTILESHDGSVPVVLPDNSVPQQLIDHAERLIQRAFEQEGQSVLGAQSKKPSGLDSGAALREFNDVESARLKVRSQSWERFIGVDLAKAVIDELQAIARDGEDEPVRVSQKTSRGIRMREVKFKDVALDDSKFLVQVAPASALPASPAGRLAAVESWIGAGLVDQEEAKQLLDFPDLAAHSAMHLAPHELILDAIEKMIDDGEHVTPEPLQNFELTLKLVSNAYQRYRTDGAPESRTSLLLEYLDGVRHLQMAAEAEATPPAPPPGPEAVDPALAGGMPEAPPGMLPG